ncbi:MAG: hypothetical protein ACOC5K_03210 [Chloroflexota bacterium]
MKPVPRVAVALSLVVALLVLFSAGSGALWWQDVYPLERESAATQAQGQDIVTVLLVLPLFLLSLFAAARGSLRGRLAWIGILAYFTYTYLSYSVGTPFNDFFHFYVAAYSLSLISLVIGVTTLDCGRSGKPRSMGRLAD